MLKTGKKIVSVIMVVIMCLTMAPLQGFVGLEFSSWFASEAKAALEHSDNYTINAVARYCYPYSASDIMNALNSNVWDLETTEGYNAFASFYNDVVSSYDERMDMLYLAGNGNDLNANEMYVSWQYKEYMSDPSVRKLVMNLSGLAFNGEAIDYVVGDWPEKDKYKDALAEFMNASVVEFEFLEFTQETMSILESVVEEIGDIAEANKIRSLQKSVSKATDTSTISSLLYEFDFSKDKYGSLIISYDNNALADAMGYLGSVVEVFSISADAIVNLAAVGQKTKVYEKFSDFLNSIISDTSLPTALRVAANELNQPMQEQYAQVTFDLAQNIGSAIIENAGDKVISGLASGVLSSITLGLDIGSFIGNVLFGMDEIVKASAYLECYGILQEKYQRKLLNDKTAFNSSPTLANANQFIFDYETLRHLRIIGEEKYIEMQGFDNLWNKKIQKALRDWGNYEEKNAFVSDNLYQLYNAKFDYSGEAASSSISTRICYSDHIQVACPVDVSVYDSNNVLVAQTINNEVVELINADTSKYPVVLYVDEDVKTIKLSNKDNYRIEISAFDSGEMTYTAKKYNERNEQIIEAVYDKIELTKNEKYVVNPETNKAEYQQLLIENGDSLEKIEPTSYYDNSTPPKAEDNIVDVIVAEELFDGFPVEVIDLVADTMFNMKSVVDLSAYDISTDDAVALFSAVAKYYPAEYSLIANSDFTYKIIVSPNLDRIMKIRFYYGDDANLSTYQKRVKDLNAEIDDLVAKVEGMNEFEKALYIHDYIVLNSEYDLELLEYMEKNNFILPGELRSEKYTEYSILVNGTGVCGSYALAYRAVLNAAGMECLYLSSSQMNHAWNLVKIDGKWYHVDCCWDDPTPDTYGRARRTYFLRTDDEIMNLNHYSWTPGQYKANSEKYSNMPRNYDIKQKYDDGKWYYLTGSTLYSSDEYGKNETEITSISASSIDADNGNVYYSNGRYIYEYNIETKKTAPVYMLSNKDSGDNPSQASLSNIYVSGECVEFYKSVHKDDKRITVYDTDILQREKFGAVTGITLASTEETANVFEKIYLNATVEKTEGIIEDYEIVWDSSNVNVASVDENGMVLCGNIGTTTITASVGSFKTECSIKVNGDGLSGMCGDNTKWSFDTMTKIFTISGNGDTYDHFDKPWYKFSNEIKYVNIEENVTSVGDMFFEGCNNLISVNIANTVKYIGQCAFSYCPKIEKIVVPDSVTHIRGNAFASCKNLKYLVFGSGLKDIDIGNALNSLENLISIEVSENNDNFMSDEYGVMYSKDQSVLYKYPAKSSLEKYVVSKHTKEINFDAFSYCTELKYIDLPEGLTEISYAFYHCYSLEYIKIPDTVTTIGSAAFGMCTNLKNVQLPKNLQVISSHAFLWCENLKRVFIPDTTKRIEGSAFSSCGIEEVVIPESVKYLGSQFSDTPAFSSIRILVKGKDLSWTRFSTNSIVYGYSNTIVEEYTTEKGIVFIAIDTDNHIHDYFLMDYVEPNKEQDGYEYYECYCGESSYATPIHYYGEEITTEPTCIVDGSKSQTCINCGNVDILETIPATGKHSYELVSTTPGTCTVAPVNTYECSTCGDTYTKTGKIEDGHKYEKTVVVPTCTEKGYTKEICTVCGETILSDFTSPKGHEFIINKSADYCSAHGTLEYACKNCDYIESVASDGENLITETVTVEPTCTNSGTKSEICTLCGAAVSVEILNPLSHDYSDEWTVDTEPTCTEKGSKSKHCARCDAKREVTAVDEAGHKYYDKWLERIAPACEKDGLEYRNCYVCNKAEETRIAGKLGHNYSSDWSVDVEPTCTAIGSKSHHCTRCNSKLDITEIAKLNHSYKAVVTTPTCTAKGYTTHTCTSCGDTYTDAETAALGHKMSAYKVTVQPTCTDKGTETATCSRCDHSETKSVAAKGHNYKDGVCTNCGKSKVENCSHLCHKKGFIGFIWKIVRFFWKLFNMNPICDCGARHY